MYPDESLVDHQNTTHTSLDDMGNEPISTRSKQKANRMREESQSDL